MKVRFPKKAENRWDHAGSAKIEINQEDSSRLKRGKGRQPQARHGSEKDSNDQIGIPGGDKRGGQGTKRSLYKKED